MNFQLPIRPERPSEQSLVRSAGIGPLAGGRVLKGRKNALHQLPAGRPTNVAFARVFTNAPTGNPIANHLCVSPRPPRLRGYSPSPSLPLPRFHKRAYAGQRSQIESRRSPIQDPRSKIADLPSPITSASLPDLRASAVTPLPRPFRSRVFTNAPTQISYRQSPIANLPSQIQDRRSQIALP